jgi:hypothetical protein
MTRLACTFLFAALALATTHAGAESPAPTVRPALAAQAARASSLLHEMSMRSDHAHAWLREARARGEFVRARCLDEKLNQLHALERVALPEMQRARAVTARGGSAASQLVRLENLATRSQQLHREAGWCGRTPIARLPTRTTVRVYVPRLPPE